MASAPDAARVLVAHDVRAYADSIAAFVGAGGYSTQTVYDGRNVGLLAESWRPHSAIIKLDLAGVSGYDLARHLRRSYGRAMWLVGASEGNVSNEEDATAAGFDRVVVRPIDTAEFLLALDAPGVLLAQKSMAATTRCLGLLVASAQAQLSQAMHTKNREQRRRAVAFATRTFDSVTKSFERAVVTPFDRQLLATELSTLAKKLKQAGASISTAA